MTFIGMQGLMAPGAFGIQGGQPGWATNINTISQPTDDYRRFPADLRPFETTAGQAPSMPQTVLTPYQVTPEVEAQAAAHFLQDAAAGLIRRLFHYLEANHQQFAQLLDCVPLVQRAAELYGVRDYTSAFSQAYQAYRAVTILQATVPGLPSLS